MSSINSPESAIKQVVTPNDNGIQASNKLSQEANEPQEKLNPTDTKTASSTFDNPISPKDSGSASTSGASGAPTDTTVAPPPGEISSNNGSSTDGTTISYPILDEPEVDSALNPHTAHAGQETAVTPDSTPTPAPIDANHGLEGIDVSQFDGTINWQDVKNSGVQYAYVRATDGTTIQDPTFETNWNGAEQAGIMVGAYHYLTTTSAIQTQIQNFVNTIGKVDAGQLPPVVDVEDPAQWKNYTVAQRVGMIQQFLDGVEKATGVEPLLYMSSSFSTQELNSAPQFDKYKLWVADYTTNPTPIVPQPWSNWTFWQNTDQAIVGGITQPPGSKERTDGDYFSGSLSDLQNLKAARTVAPTAGDDNNATTPINTAPES